MKVRLLGTGDATGTPKIGCSCPQCRHAVSHGIQRLRTSLLIEEGPRHILVETTPDLRQQLLSCGSPHIDAIIWTHGHYDHFMGLGEFYRVQEIPEIYGSPGVVAYCGDIFRFLGFHPHPMDPYLPFTIGNIEFTLLPVNHPPAETCGLLMRYKNTRVGFTSDTNTRIPERTLALLEDLDLLIVDAIAPPEFHIEKHLNYQESVDLARRLRAVDFRCVHMGHFIPFGLPHTGYDGECFTFPG